MNKDKRDEKSNMKIRKISQTMKRMRKHSPDALALDGLNTVATWSHDRMHK
jgi:hypothetical protein